MAYVALPGGPGTLDEISDVIALARLGIDGKPCVLYDLDGFYQPLKKVFEKMIDSGFAYQEDFRNVLISPISKRSERLSKKEGWRKNEKALLVIDMQNVCVGEKHAAYFKYNNRELIQKVNKIIDANEKIWSFISRM